MELCDTVFVIHPRCLKSTDFDMNLIERIFHLEIQSKQGTSNNSNTIELRNTELIRQFLRLLTPQRPRHNAEWHTIGKTNVALFLLPPHIWINRLNVIAHNNNSNHFYL